MQLIDIANRFGTPCYVYDMEAVRVRASQIRNHFRGHFGISYAVKSNPNISVLRRLKVVVDTLDISSGGELRRALSAGWDPSLISFTGPGKTDAELQAAVDAKIGYVIVESVAEAERLSSLAVQSGHTQPILLRIAPAHVPAGFGSGMAGKPCQFGIDEETCEAAITRILNLANVPVKGFHIYSGTQCLKADAIVQNYENMARIFRHLCGTFGMRPEKLIFGSGLGIPYHQGDKPLQLEEVAAGANPLLAGLLGEKRFQQTRLLLEIGRHLIGEAGRYLTRIVQIKESRGAEICICDGGMNHHLAACGLMGAVIPRNYRISKIGSSPADEPMRTYEIVGPLCTSIDRLGRSVPLPRLQTGDVLAVECSGAYGLTSSPVHFISHEKPKEIIIDTVGGNTTADDVSEA